MSNDDLKGLEPKANKTNYVGSDSEEGMSTMTTVHEDVANFVGRLHVAAENKRQIGVLSASMLIFNRVIGTGIFATPGSILALLGSPGLALIIWVVGSIIAAAGTAVYLEWGTGIPKNGGEKNYLEFIYRKPKFLVTGIYASYIILMGWASGNSVVFGEYILHAANKEVDRWNQRGIGLACITTAFIIHGTALKWGLRLQNALGIIKLIIVFIMIICGFVALGGHLKTDEKPNNFSNAFEGTTGSAYGVVTALYNVIWSFVGYSNANYALSETRNPVRTLKIAAPTAIISVSIIYILVNIAYFAAVSKAEIIASERLVAASLFRNVMGPAAERAMSVFVALSAFGNVLSVIFSQGRLVQELGREGILPFSRLWASNRPFNAPLAGLFEHWVICVIVILAPPPGDAYNFILKYNWNPPIKATLPVTVFFLLSNMYLVIAPFIAPDDPSQNQYKSMPYYIHCVVGIAILVAGAIYWLVWAVILPKIGGYKLVRETHLYGINYDPATSNNREINTKHCVPTENITFIQIQFFLTSEARSQSGSGSDPLKLIGASSPAENDVSPVLLLPPTTVLSEPQLPPILFFKHITSHNHDYTRQNITAIMSKLLRLRARPLTWGSTFTARQFSTTRPALAVRGGSKLFKDADAAVADIKSGSILLSSGFGLCGVADTLIGALNRRGRDSLNSLTAVSNNAGVEGKGGLATLTSAGQVDRLILSYLGNNKVLEKKYLTGELAIELCPQGTLAERIRAAGAGIPAFFTPTAAHTLLQDGEIPVRLDKSGAVVEKGRKRETREFNGRTFLMETAIEGDVAIIRAWKADKEGNC
ncbi:MUP1-high affinity methionine permease, partial [Fusarium napiforme]